MAKKSNKGGINNAYLGILKEFEGKKEAVLKGYLRKMDKVKKQGMKKIEAEMSKSDAEAAKKLLDQA
jgi:hypothetical protein